MSRKQAQLQQAKLQAEADYRQKFNHEKAKIELEQQQRQEDIKTEYNRKLDNLKSKLDAKLKIKFTDSENEMIALNSGQLKKDIDAYKRLREQESKKAMTKIEQEH